MSDGGLHISVCTAVPRLVLPPQVYTAFLATDCCDCVLIQSWNEKGTGMQSCYLLDSAALSLTRCCTRWCWLLCAAQCTH